MTPTSYVGQYSSAARSEGWEKKTSRDRRGADPERVAHVGGGAVDGDDDGRARVDAEAGEQGPRPHGRGHDLPGSRPRPPVAEHDESGTLQHERTVQHHQVSAAQVLRRLVGEHDGAVGDVHEPEVPDDGDPVRRPGVAELAGAPHPVHPSRSRGVMSNENVRHGSRASVSYTSPRAARASRDSDVSPSVGEPLQEALTVVVQQGRRGTGQLKARQTQRPLLARPGVLARRSAQATTGRDGAQRRHREDGAGQADAAARCRHVTPGAGREAPVILSPAAAQA